MGLGRERKLKGTPHPPPTCNRSGTWVPLHARPGVPVYAPARWEGVPVRTPGGEVGTGDVGPGVSEGTLSTRVDSVRLTPHACAVRIRRMCYFPLERTREDICTSTNNFR